MCFPCCGKDWTLMSTSSPLDSVGGKRNGTQLVSQYLCGCPVMQWDSIIGHIEVSPPALRPLFSRCCPWEGDGVSLWMAAQARHVTEPSQNLRMFSGRGRHHPSTADSSAAAGRRLLVRQIQYETGPAYIAAGLHIWRNVPLSASWDRGWYSAARPTHVSNRHIIMPIT